MGKYCLAVGTFVAAQVGEQLSIKKFPSTFAVVNGQGQPVCIPHEGCTIEFISVDPGLASHPVLGGLRPGQTAHYQIVGAGSRERDVVALKTGKIVSLETLGSSTFQIAEEQQP